MPKNNTAYKFRIYPNEEQNIMIAKTFGCCRFIYNSMLADKIEEYEKNNRMLKITPAGYKRLIHGLRKWIHLPCVMKAFILT